MSGINDRFKVYEGINNGESNVFVWEICWKLIATHGFDLEGNIGRCQSIRVWGQGAKLGEAKGDLWSLAGTSYVFKLLVDPTHRIYSQHILHKLRLFDFFIVQEMYFSKT